VNNPLSFIDPRGLVCEYFKDSGIDVESLDYNSSAGECADTGGTWIADSNGEISLCDASSTICVTVSAKYLPVDGGDNTGGVPFNPVVSQLNAFAVDPGPFWQFIDNSVKTLGCASGALLNEVPFGLGKYLGAPSPDKVSGKLRLAGAVLSPNPDKKIAFVLLSNYALNTERAVNVLNKLNLPTWAEATGAVAAKAGPVLTPFAKWLGIAGWTVTAVHTTRSTARCYNNN
jgi:hypothetical protein